MSLHLHIDTSLKIPRKKNLKSWLTDRGSDYWNLVLFWPDRHIADKCSVSCPITIGLQNKCLLPLYCYISFDFNGFTPSWTLSSMFFSMFLLGTRWLSVLYWYLALDGVYLNSQTNNSKKTFGGEKSHHPKNASVPMTDIRQTNRCPKHRAQHEEHWY